MTNKTIFKVNEKSFIAIAGETHNSSASSASYMLDVWKKAKEIGLNTVLMPVSWELIEPEEDRFDFDLVKQLILQARENDMHIIFLWFGSWKNAQCLYVPEWVKKNQERFKRAEIEKGKRKVYLKDFYNIPYTSLSYCCDNNWKTDAKAFAKLMEYLKSVDEKEHTVIGIQVENETGIQGAAREHSDIADEIYKSEVPETFVTYMREHVEFMADEVRQSVLNGNVNGNWNEVFGRNAEEIFSAYHIASYVEKVASAGKQVYDLPMFVNCWLEQGVKPGQYPSGGPIAKMMEVWKYAAPSIELFAPDIYVRNFIEVCDEYSKLDNQLVIPETATHSHCAPRLVYCVGHYHTSCFASFGFEDMGQPFTNAQAALFGVDVSDPLLQIPQNVEEYCWCANTLNSMMDLLLDKYKTEDLQAVISERVTNENRMNFGMFGFKIDFHNPTITRDDGVCLILKQSEDTFYILANGCCITPYSMSSSKPDFDIISLDEGEFVDGMWQACRRLNGDEAFTLIYNEYNLLKIKLWAY